MSFWKNQNADVALAQAGSAGAQKSGLVLGSRKGIPTLHEPEDLRYALAQFSTQHVAYYSDFLGALSAAPQPLQSDTSANAGSVAVADSLLTLNADGTASGDYQTVALGTHWTVSNGWTLFDAYFSLSSIADVAVEVGLSDAASETNGLAFSDHTVAGVTDVATDAAVIAFDAGGDSNLVVNTANGGTPQAVDTGTTPVAGTFYHVRLELANDGTLYAYLNSTLVATVEDAVATTASLTPWVTVSTQTTATKALNVDYLGVAGNR